MTTPTQTQIDDVLDQCIQALDNGSRWPGMSYEQGDGSHPLEE